MSYQPSAYEHKYSNSVTVLENPVVSTLLTEICKPECTQPRFNRVLKKIYSLLITECINSTLPTVTQRCPTRMSEQHPEVVLESQVFDPNSNAVVVDIARAGMLPSQILFDSLCDVIDPNKVRQDHIFASRAVDSDNRVTHTQLSSSKVGDDVSEAFVFIADPMGATGHSMTEVIDFYKNLPGPAPKAFVALHMIITPEYISQMSRTHPDLKIITARVDRGLSSKEVLQSPLGTHPEQEVGLNELSYIVPGAGGIGEIINNCFV